MSPTERVTTEDLAAVPLAYRRTIARWLAERARGIKASWIFPEVTAQVARDQLSGAAADLVDPEAEDSTTGHAAEALAGLFAGAEHVLVVADGVWVSIVARPAGSGRAAAAISGGAVIATGQIEWRAGAILADGAPSTYVNAVRARARAMGYEPVGEPRNHAGCGCLELDAEALSAGGEVPRVGDGTWAGESPVVVEYVRDGATGD